MKVFQFKSNRKYSQDIKILASTIEESCEILCQEMDASYSIDYTHSFETMGYYAVYIGGDFYRVFEMGKGII